MDTAAFDKLAGRVERPDDAARAATADLLRDGGSFGGLVEAATWLSAVTGVSPPPAPARAQLLIAAADGSVPEAPRRIAAALGRAARSVDLGREGVGGVELDTGTGTEAGDPVAAVAEALARGVALADAEADAGTDLLLLAATVPLQTLPDAAAAATIVAACTKADTQSLIAAGADDTAWMRAVAAVRDGLRRVRRAQDDPIEMLAAAGGTELAQLTGVLLGAAARRTPVVVEGLPALAAALVVHRATDASAGWLLAAHTDRDPAAVAAMRHLGLTPLFDLGLAPGTGAACALTVPLLTAAAALAVKDAAGT